MVTYLVGTDGEPASEAICDHLDPEVGPDDRLEVINVQETNDVEAHQAGEAALALFEERFGDRTEVTVRQVNRGNPPAEELTAAAEEADADHIVAALRRHSRTERVIFGSVSHSLLQRVTRPITLVPLEEYQAPSS